MRIVIDVAYATHDDSGVATGEGVLTDAITEALRDIPLGMGTTVTKATMPVRDRDGRDLGTLEVTA